MPIRRQTRCHFLLLPECFRCSNKSLTVPWNKDNVCNVWNKAYIVFPSLKGSSWQAASADVLFSAGNPPDIRKVWTVQSRRLHPGWSIRVRWKTKPRLLFVRLLTSGLDSLVIQWLSAGWVIFIFFLSCAEMITSSRVIFRNKREG